MTKEALKLALEAFGEINWSNNSQWQSDRAKVAIATLKKALANEALEKMAENARELGLDYEPEQEPVAWKDMAFARLGVVRNKMHHADVETIQRFLDGDYTTPPQRKPLTDEEVNKLVDDEDWYNDPHGFARAIEAAHGIKGEA